MGKNIFIIILFVIFSNNLLFSDNLNLEREYTNYLINKFGFKDIFEENSFIQGYTLKKYVIEKGDYKFSYIVNRDEKQLEFLLKEYNARLKFTERESYFSNNVKKIIEFLIIWEF